MTNLPADLLDHLADVGNKALGDWNHENLCACGRWPDSCASGFTAGNWDTVAFDIALPAIIAAYEQHKEQQ
ncbi:hypothetical protein [Kitasatospora sp. NPDC056731]|uniref:hypothetical protein n=1 Tax=Kitasatospora sp. NPDC056731 TaxID=3155422 RepID=UPI003442D227